MASSPHLAPPTRHDGSLRPGERLSFRLPAVETAVAEARRRLRCQLSRWGITQEACDDAQLVISELVTNALRHTASETVGCEARLMGALIRVAVASDGAGPGQEPSRAAEEDENGRGLFLVCALAERWGVRPQDSGRGHIVWADLATRPGCQR
ncbi:ATP-binding protein [Streptomyces sp. 4N509B]|uniref:ATP-binding protein n=1 Tax=Streptomyces sp. 4N509B TaxID=3457413 RepID=UPI003FD6B732